MTGVPMHGQSRTPEFRAWWDMRQRCLNPNVASYANYGGRGIRVCDRWNDFSAFRADMGCRPSPAHSLDRIDNDGNYEPGNCRWATRSEQQRNKRAYRSEALPRGDAHWTRRDPDRAASVARQNARPLRGSKNGRARLTESDVARIKRRIEAGETDASIAADHAVRPGAIWFIRTGKHWSHVA